MMKRQLLEGIRVADFGWVATGPLSTKYLADCGAEVIKIESKTRGDGLGGKRNNVFWFNQWNSSKLSVTLNLSRPKAKEVAKKIVAKSDIVSENFAAGTMNRLGLGYEELKKAKPDIIMLSSCMLGQTGPYATSPGHGDVLGALTGINQLTGWPDRDPARLGNYTDYIVPHFNALAILAALYYRQRTGKGQYLDTAGHEASLQFMTPLLLDYVVNRRIANRMGNRSTYAAPHAAYRCHGDDRWCVIAVFTDTEWQSFCRVIGNTAWTQDARFGTLLARKKHEDELDKLVTEWTISHSAEEVMEKLQAAGVAAGVVATGEDLLEHNPQLEHEHFFWRLDHPQADKKPAIHRSPFIPSKAYYEVRRSPLVGEHNEYVLKGLLGLSDEEVAELVRDGSLE